MTVEMVGRKIEDGVRTDAAGLFVVSVALAVEGSRADLLAMASVLHRRGVDALEAEIGRPAHGRRVFTATFSASPRRAETVLNTYLNLVDVLDASLYEAFDARSAHLAVAGP